MEITAVTRFKLGALHIALRKLGWTQSELARRAGMTNQQIGEVINMKRRPTLASATKIQAAFGEAGVYLDVLEIWPSAFKGFNNALIHEETRDIELGQLPFYASHQLAEFNIDPELLAEALDSLDPQDRELLELHYAEGLTQADAARRAHLRAATRSNASFRICNALRKVRSIVFERAESPAFTKDNAKAAKRLIEAGIKSGLLQRQGWTKKAVTQTAHEPPSSLHEPQNRNI